MKKNELCSKLLLVAAISAAMCVGSVSAFADWRGGGEERHFSGGRHENVNFRGERFVFHEGRFFRPTFWGLGFDWVVPPIGVVVSYLPVGCTAVIFGGTTYYAYDNVYYQSYGGGYMVVAPPPVTEPPPPPLPMRAAVLHTLETQA